MSTTVSAAAAAIAGIEYKHSVRHIAMAKHSAKYHLDELHAAATVLEDATPENTPRAQAAFKAAYKRYMDAEADVRIWTEMRDAAAKIAGIKVPVAEAVIDGVSHSIEPEDQEEARRYALAVDPASLAAADAVITDVKSPVLEIDPLAQVRVTIAADGKITIKPNGGK